MGYTLVRGPLDKFGDAGLVSLNAAKVLTVLGMGERMMSELAFEIGVCTAAMTGLVDRLAVLRLVTRKPDKNDRRKWLVSLTDEGWRLIGEVLAMAEGQKLKSEVEVEEGRPT